MGQVTVTLNGRTYRLKCGDGEETRLLELAHHVREKIEHLAIEFGQVGDDRLTVMAALLITDELFDAREALKQTAILPDDIASLEPPASPINPAPLPSQLQPDDTALGNSAAHLDPLPMSPSATNSAAPVPSTQETSLIRALQRSQPKPAPPKPRATGPSIEERLAAARAPLTADDRK